MKHNEITITKQQVRNTGKFIVKHKTEILTGALVVVIAKNRSLSKKNRELLTVIEELSMSVNAAETVGLLDRFFGRKG